MRLSLFSRGVVAVALGVALVVPTAAFADDAVPVASASAGVAQSGGAAREVTYGVKVVTMVDGVRFGENTEAFTGSLGTTTVSEMLTSPQFPKIGEISTRVSGDDPVEHAQICRSVVAKNSQGSISGDYVLTASDFTVESTNNGVTYTCIEVTVSVETYVAEASSVVQLYGQIKGADEWFNSADFDESNWTADSIQAARNALDQAKVVLDNIQSTTDDVNAAYDQLVAAMRGVEPSYPDTPVDPDNPDNPGPSVDQVVIEPAASSTVKGLQAVMYGTEEAIVEFMTSTNSTSLSIKVSDTVLDEETEDFIVKVGRENDFKVAGTYDIELINSEGNVIPVSGSEGLTFNVGIPLTDAMIAEIDAGRELMVCHIPEDGSYLEGLACWVEGDCIWFSTNHFSTYAVISYDPNGTGTGEAPEEEKPQTENKDNKTDQKDQKQDGAIPQTGDVAFMTVLGTTAVAGLSFAAAAIARRREH